MHWLVWKNDFSELDRELASKKHDIEMQDPRGRTPLMLAVTLGHLESVRILLRHNANVNVENSGGWTVVQEAAATGDPELLQEVVEKRDYQRYNSRVIGIPELLQRLKEAPDFYVEMKWEFTSWVPLVARMCPSDTYRVSKSGSNVRIDTTLLGFEQSNWQRGNRSYIFKGQRDSAIMMEIDHDTRQVYVEQLRVTANQLNDMTCMKPSDDLVSARLTTPIVTTFIDTDKISFERNKTGIWGWRSDKMETVNNYDCKVYGACNVELVTKTRTEHLTEADKARCKSPKTPFQSFLGIAEIEEKANAPVINGEVSASFSNPCNITPEEYFDANVDLHGRDIGRPKETTVKTQKFKANLWLCDDYPLSLPEQILPIVDLMAISSSHFAKLKDFITLQLPSGFPVKIEIPLLHVLNARITFGNIFALDGPVHGVSTIRENDRITCVLDESFFEPPSDYLRLGSDGRRQFSMDDEDELVQYAIQQSLMECGTESDQVTVWEALRNQQPSRPSTPSYFQDEDHLIQRAIQESLSLSHPLHVQSVSDSSKTTLDPLQPDSRVADFDIDRGECQLEDQLRLALELSEKEQKEEERRQREEEEMMEKVLKLSLTET